MFASAMIQPSPSTSVARFAICPSTGVNTQFVDIGSGKGRVLIAAAEHPFLQVAGVEYSKELHEAALNNIRSAKRIKCRTLRRFVCTL